MSEEEYKSPCTECFDRVNGRCNRDCPFWGADAVREEVAKSKKFDKIK